MTGVINILKPSHMTSHDVVAIARGVLGTKKIGHTGTLDPMAAGVLVLCAGKATKVVEFLQTDKKLYRCALVLGSSTDTQDAWGKVLSISPMDIDINIVKNTIDSFVGEIEQIPPMYSAVKVGGKRLYEIARRGDFVERKTRKCCIYKIDILRVDKNVIWIDVLCSKGTYIRTLCNDIGKQLGCGAHMGFLLRLKTGVFSIEDSITIEEFKKMKANLNFANKYNYLQTIDFALSDLKKIKVPINFCTQLKNGIKLNLAQFVSDKSKENELYRVYADQFIGVARCLSVDRCGKAITIKMQKNLF